MLVRRVTAEADKEGIWCGVEASGMYGSGAV